MFSFSLSCFSLHVTVSFSVSTHLCLSHCFLSLSPPPCVCHKRQDINSMWWNWDECIISCNIQTTWPHDVICWKVSNSSLLRIYKNGSNCSHHGEVSYTPEWTAITWNKALVLFDKVTVVKGNESQSNSWETLKTMTKT